MRKLPVTVLSGFFDDGKTARLDRMLNNRGGLRTAVVVSDMSEMDIGAALARDGGADRSRTDAWLVEMTNGCIGGLSRDDLLAKVHRLAEEDRFDHVLIVSTGISEPLPVAAVFGFRDEAGASLSDVAKRCSMVTVVDTANLLDDSASSDFLRDRLETAGDGDARLLVDLVDVSDLTPSACAKLSAPFPNRSRRAA